MAQRTPLIIRKLEVTVDADPDAFGLWIRSQALFSNGQITCSQFTVTPEHVVRKYPEMVGRIINAAKRYMRERQDSAISNQ
jgi:hypothetical protein